MKIQLPHNWRPRWYQMPAWEYLENGGRQCELVWHRRSGKDELSLHHTAVSMYQRPGNYWHMLPKANQARKALWDAINPHTGKRRVDEAFPEALRTGYNDHEMMVKFGPSTWQVVGSDNFDALVGSPPIGLVFSEWALSDPSSWAYLRPILAENGGWVIKNTTPRGKNHAYRTFKSAQKDKGAFAQVLTVKDTDVFTPETLAKELKDLIDDYGPDFGQSKFDQEYMCSWEAANLGAILGRWLQRAHIQNRITDGVFDPNGSPIEISSDIGFRDTASWWFWQPRADGFGVVNYIGASGLEAGDWIPRLKAICEAEGYRLGHIYLPQDAKAKTFASKRSPMEQFVQGFGEDVIRITPQTKVFDRVNAARTVIEKCWFEETKTDEGREGLSAWQYEYDEERKEFSKDPRHDWASHPGDAFSYGALVMSEREVESPKETPEDARTRFTKELMEGALVIGGPSNLTLNDAWKTARRPSARI